MAGKILQCWNLNKGTLALEVTALPTKPQQLPFWSDLIQYIILDQTRNALLNELMRYFHTLKEFPEEEAAQMSFELKSGVW